LRSVHASVLEYYCFLLLDFVAVERDLEELPIAAALTIAEQLDVKPRLIELLRQEIKLRKGQLDKIDANKESLLRDAEQAALVSGLGEKI
jgi:hypothetical protein